MFRSLFLLLLVLSLCACGRSQPTAYYTFAPRELLTNVNRLPKTTLRIARVAIPQYLERDSIVVRSANPVTLKVDSLNVWAEPLGDGIRRMVYAECFEPLLAKNIAVLPLASDAQATYTLLLDIVSFDGDGKRAMLSTQWTLVETTSNHTLANGVFSAKKALPHAGYEAFVEAESALVQECAHHILDQITPVLQKGRR
ncbi:MAG: membrane integrity-associated transporter subunit PqiC [Desulfovibrio sp.]|nr:membrane integrity-associated transporter subunit PqiC [Desulfovibrio sp.]